MARQAASPVRHSSCTCAGMPNRLAGHHVALPLRPGSRIPSAGSTGAVPNVPGELAEPVGDRPRPTAAAARCVSLSIGAIPPASGSSHQTAAELGDLLREGHPRRSGRRPASSTGAVRRRATGSVIGHLRGRGRTAHAPAWCRGSRGSPRALARDQGDQHRDRVVTHLPHRLLHGRQRRVGERRLGDVVEARPPTAARARRRPARRRRRGSASAEMSLAAKIAVGGSGRSSSVAGGLARLLGVEGTAREQRLVDRQAGRGVRVAVALLAQLGGDQVGATGDHADAACARARAGGRRPAGRPAGCRRRPSAGCDRPVCGSTATTGPSYWTSVTVGVTSTAPSTRVPITRER